MLFTARLETITFRLDRCCAFTDVRGRAKPETKSEEKGNWKRARASILKPPPADRPTLPPPTPPAVLLSSLSPFESALAVPFRTCSDLTRSYQTFEPAPYAGWFMEAMSRLYMFWQTSVVEAVEAYHYRRHSIGWLSSTL